MENRKLTNSSSEELNEEVLGTVSGGTDNGAPIPYLSRGDSDLAFCTVCGKLKKIEYYYHEKRICGACLEKAR